MRKLLHLILILTVSLIPLGVYFVSAHPLDVSNTTLTIYPRTIEGVTYLHPAELDRILVLSGGIDPARISVALYYAMTGTLTKYLEETMIVENDGEVCHMGNFGILDGLMVDEIFRNGFPISYTVSCSSNIETPLITINICGEVQLQTNRLYVYASQSGSAPVKRDYRVLNIHKNSHTIILDAPTTLIDTDHDGLPDEDEVLYRTDPSDADTDHDGYTDREEIDSSWNPLSRELSPGQSLYDPSTHTAYQGIGGGPHVQAHTLSQDTVVWGGQRFAQILTDIRLYIDDHGDWKKFYFLLLSVAVLGFVHALGPGHSKGILISQILDQNLSLQKGILYALVFSVVHLFDIVVVVLISKYLLKLFDPGKYLGTIQFMSILLILVVSIFLFITSLRHFLIRGEKREQKSRKQHILLAIISGITPCAFGWSIFLLLFAVRRTDLALPLLCALGIGIFLCLVLITFITFLIKDRVYSFSPRIGMVSPVISSVFLFGIGSFLLVQTF